MNPTPKISVVVIGYNDEANIRACLDSVRWADEIIFVDSFSTDATATIAAEFTNKVFQHKFEGFGKLRNDAVAHAANDWIFSLDTDERATPKLFSRPVDQTLRLVSGLPTAAVIQPAPHALPGGGRP